VPYLGLSIALDTVITDEEIAATIIRGGCGGIALIGLIAALLFYIHRISKVLEMELEQCGASAIEGDSITTSRLSSRRTPSEART
jgi:hypothetical protein